MNDKPQLEIKDTATIIYDEMHKMSNMPFGKTALALAVDSQMKQWISKESLLLLLQAIDYQVACLEDDWSTRKSDYETHNCNNQDSNDISFTKKSFESFVQRIKELTTIDNIVHKGETRK